jgi:hypothetical protein
LLNLDPRPRASARKYDCGMQFIWRWEFTSGKIKTSMTFSPKVQSLIASRKFDCGMQLIWYARSLHQEGSNQNSELDCPAYTLEHWP